MEPNTGHDVVHDFAGALTGLYRRDEVDALRREWDRPTDDETDPPVVIERI